LSGVDAAYAQGGGALWVVLLVARACFTDLGGALWVVFRGVNVRCTVRCTVLRYGVRFYGTVQ